jgi:hypothetical protein
MVDSSWLVTYLITKEVSIGNENKNILCNSDMGNALHLFIQLCKCQSGVDKACQISKKIRLFS